MLKHNSSKTKLKLHSKQVPSVGGGGRGKTLDILMPFLEDEFILSNMH